MLCSLLTLSARLKSTRVNARGLKACVTYCLILLLAANPLFAARPELKRPQPTSLPVNFAVETAAPVLARYVVPAIVQADKQMVSKAIQSGNAAFKLRKNGLGEVAAPSLGLLVDIFKANPDGASMSVAQMSQLFRRSRDKSVSASAQDSRDAFRAGIRIAGSIQSALKGGDTSVGALSSIEAIERQATDDGALPDSQTNLVAQSLKYANIEAKTSTYISTKVGEAYELAQANSKFKAVIDLTFGDLFNANISDDANTVIQKNKEDVPDSVKALVNVDSTVSVSTTIVENSYRNECTTVHNITSTVITEVKVIPIKPAVNPDAKKLADEEKKFQDREDKINKASNAISFLSGLIGRVNPEYGRKAQVIGDALVKTAHAINGFKKAQDQFFSSGVGSVLKDFLSPNVQNLIGGALLATNVVGIAMTAFKLFKAFGSQEPSPEQLILEQLAQLRKEVQQMRQEMHERFDQIDQKLNTIYDKMNDRFDRVDWQLGVLRDNIDDIRTELVGLHGDLNRLERNIYTWIEEVGRRDLKLEIAQAIGYRATTGTDMPYTPDYVNHATFFHLWATNIGKDQVQAGTLARDYTDAKVYDELNNFPLDTNINYLAQFPAKNLGGDPLTSESNRLVNPRDWQIVSEAYLQLAREWPQHAQRYSPDKLKEIYAIGQQVQAAVEGITTISTSSGKKPNRRLFDALIAKYNLKANVLGAAIKKAEDDYKNDPANKGLKEFEIWGDINQPTSVTLPSSIDPCRGTEQTTRNHTTPNNLPVMVNQVGNSNLSIAYPYRIAEKLGIGRLNYCMESVWTPYPTPKVYSSIQHRFHVRFITGNAESGDLASLQRTMSGQIYDGNVDDMRRAWDDQRQWKREFETTDTNVVPYNDAPRLATLAATTEAVKNEFKRHRLNVIQRTLAEFSKTGNIQSAARELSGAKKLLDAYIALGMPRSLETNDYLRSLLYGSDQVPDENSIKAIYEKALADLNAGKTIARPDITQYTTPRSNELSIVLNAILGEIQQYHQTQSADPVFYNYPEALDTVSETLQSLETQNTEATLGKYLVAHPQSLGFSANTAQEVTLTATDVAGATLSFSVVKQPEHGGLTGTAPNLIYTPQRDYVGKDSFSFKANNGVTDSNIALISLNLTGGAPCSALTFLPPKKINNGVRPYGLVTGLFNNDRFPDLAVSNIGSGSVSVYFGNGSGDFTKEADYTTGQGPGYLVTGDFNGDRLTDIAVPNQSGAVSILLGNGSGGFNKAPDVRVGVNLEALAVGDFNGDNKQDLVVTDSADNSASNVFLLLGNGSGGYTVGTSLKLRPRPRFVSEADFNRDRKLDVIVANYSAGEVTVLLGDGKGGFPQTQSFFPRPYTGHLAVADFDQDGLKDVAVISRDADQQIAVMFGAEGGNFEGTANYNLSLNPGAVISRDFNLDGRLDLAIAPAQGNTVTVLTGDELGLFSEAGSFSGAFGAYAIASDDFNQDGKPDLAVPNYYDDTISILLNTTCKPALTAPQTLAVVSAASYRGLRTAANSIVAGFGDGLATGTQAASTLPLPTLLAGATVKVKDSAGAEYPAPLFFVAPGQINFLVPERVLLGEATFTANSSSGKVSLGTLQIDRVVPGLFTANANGLGVPAAVALRVKASGAQSSELIARFDSAPNRFVPIPIDLGFETDQVFLSLFGTGWRNRNSLSGVSVTIGNVEAPVFYAGAQGDLVGLDQLNVRIPRSLIGRGEVDLVLSVDGVAANVVRINIK